MINNNTLKKCIPKMHARKSRFRLGYVQVQSIYFKRRNISMALNWPIAALLPRTTINDDYCWNSVSRYRWVYDIIKNGDISLFKQYQHILYYNVVCIRCTTNRQSNAQPDSRSQSGTILFHYMWAASVVME